MFAYNIEKNGTDVVVTLQGRLDGNAAPKFHEEMAKLQGQGVTSVTFQAGELEYISSAGLRVIVFVKQKLGADVTLYMKDVTEGVKSVLEVTGFIDFVELI